MLICLSPRRVYAVLFGSAAALAAMVGCGSSQHDDQAANLKESSAASAAQNTEPEYDGKPLSAWVRQLKVEGPRRKNQRPTESTEALVHIGEPAARALFEIVKTRYPSGDETACVYASDVLMAMGPVAVPIVETGLRHKSAFVRIDAAVILGKIYAGLEDAAGLAASVDVLAAALEHENAFVHELALIALHEFGPSADRALPQIVKALDEPKLRYGAIIALGNIGPKAAVAVPELEDAAEDRELSVRQAAHVALAKIRADVENLENR